MSYAKIGIEQLKRKYKIVLLTNSIKRFAEKILKKNRLGEFFDRFMFAEDFTTKEDAFRKISKMFKVKMNEILYIADKINDIKIAKRIGCNYAISLACSWDRNLFRKRGKFVINNLEELAEVAGLKIIP